MTFLNPAILWALAAISIPILIHIFNLKKTKKIEFSTLMFLKEIQQSKYKKIKLKQLLILLCRIGFISMLVLMFAGPFYKGYLGSEKARSSVLIILDDSFSMQTRETSGNTFENAKNRINETLNILNTNDEVYFTTVSGISSPGKNFYYKDIGKLRDTLSSIKTSDVSKSLNEVLYFAGEILKSSSHLNKEIFIFTDGQKSFIEQENIISESIKPDEQTKINIVLCGSRSANNISVDTINIISKIFEKNKPVKIRTSINNHNNFNAVNKSISINYGSYRDEKVIDIPANSTVDVEFIINPKTTGFAGGYIELNQNEISDDEISGDNKQFFTFFIPQKISLLLASGPGTELDYLNLALSSSEELLKDSLGSSPKYFEKTEISSNDLINQNLIIYNSVVIVNKPDFTEKETKKLKDYIENGGGVIIYPGQSVSAENYNNTFLKEMALPFINGSYENENQQYKFDRVDLEHSIFEGIFKNSVNNNISIESPSVKSGLNLMTGENSIPLITLNNEKNFLVEYSKGNGKLLMFGVSPDMNNSDYPAKNLFSPITVRSILYLANINNVKPGLTGKDYFVEVKILNKPLDSLEISTTSDGNVFSKIKIDTSAIFINLNKHTYLTSNYIIKNNDAVVYQFSTNFQKKEALPVKKNAEEIAEYFGKNNKFEPNIIKAAEIVSASAMELRTGKDIWHYFLILGLIFLTIEFLLAYSLSKSK